MSVQSRPGLVALQVLLPAWGTTIGLQWVLARLAKACDLARGLTALFIFLYQVLPHKAQDSAYDTTCFPS